MRIAYLIELIVALAVGFAAARWRVGGLEEASNGITSPAFSRQFWFNCAADGFLAGTALVGLIGLTVEVARGRSPRPWGSGRWAWSFLGLTLVLYPIASVAIDVIGRAWSLAVLRGSVVTSIPNLFRFWLSSWSANDLFLLVVALIIARRMANPDPVATDAREWAGRGFATLVAVISFGRYLAERGQS